MCGIAGRFHPEFLPEDGAWHVCADRLLQHRGPDGKGRFIDANCELIHRRLALLDLSPTGNQPLCNGDETVYVVFNGEIYNHCELRDELRTRGYAFRGTSDTEVLVHLYSEYGTGMVERLRGMFAFGLYDRGSRKLLLARDRFGIKPLFYAHQNDQWIFASEIKAITAVQGFQATLDRQACYDYLGISYMPDPLTGFKEISSLPAGTWLEVSACGAKTHQYFAITPEPDYGLNLDAAAEEVAEALLAAVRSQSQADVPVAALLSGGIDSGLTIAAYAQNGGHPATFTVSFADADHDESRAASIVANHYQLAHTTVHASDWNLTPDVLCDLLQHFDQPFADTSLIPMYRISKAVRDQGFICTLSGDGGDEVFGGYSRFPRANKFRKLMALPNSLLEATAFATGFLKDYTRDSGRQVSKAMKLALAGKSDPSRLVAGLSSFIAESEKEELVNAGLRQDLATAYRHFNGYTHQLGTLDDLSRHLTANLFHVSLPGDMLRKVDMMSMRASIEVRVPMLDERMVELGMRLPHRLKTDGRFGKLVLRAIASRWLPSRVAELPKHGFMIPLDRLLGRDFDAMVRDLLLSPSSRIRGIFNTQQISRWLRMFDASRRGSPSGAISREGVYSRLFIVLGLEVWMRRYRLVW